MPGDIDPGYARCAFCGVTVPSESLTDGECTDRQWCATQVGKQVSESEQVLEQVKAAVEAERESCAEVATEMTGTQVGRLIAAAIRARGTR